MIDLDLDKYAHINSPIHRWDARFKLVGMLGLIFSFSSVQDLRLMPVILGITLVIFLISHLPMAYLAARLRYPGIFLIAVAIVLPIFSGSIVLMRLGPIALYQEGLTSLLLIVVKFLCILTLGVVLFGSSTLITNIKAMRNLRLPPILADMMLLTYRYIFELGYDLKTMEMSMRLRNHRAGRFSLRSINTLASLSGTLLIRSYERAERIYKAMILRGYGNKNLGVDAGQSIFSANPADIIAMVGFLITGVLLIFAECYLRQL